MTRGTKFQEVFTLTPLVPVAVALMAGIVIGRETDVPLTWTFGLMCCWTVTVRLLKKQKNWQTAGILVAVLLTGCTICTFQKQHLTVEWPKEYRTWKIVVTDEPVVKPKSISIDALTAISQRKIRCYVARSEDSEKIKVGDVLSAEMKIRNIHSWPNSTFDYPRYMASHGFSGEAYIGDNHWNWCQAKATSWSRLQRFRIHCMQWRHQLIRQMEKWQLSPEARGIIKAMTLGERSQLDPTLKASYAKVGASHILALSGLHLTIIFWILALFISWIRLRTLAHTLLVVAIWGYAFLVGLSPSVTRAAFMVSVYTLLSLGYRDPLSVNTLAFTAIVMLLINPLALYDVSFQLSYSAIFAILTIVPLFQPLVSRSFQRSHRVLAFLWGIAIVSLAAQIGTAPLMAHHFGTFAPYSVLASFIVIPCAYIIIIATIVTLSVGWFPSLEALLSKGLSLTVSLMNDSMERIADLPFSNIENSHLSVEKTLFLYTFMLGIYFLVKFFKKKYVVTK